MFCIYCGAPNPDDAAFCSACGKAIARTAAKASSPQPVGPPDLPAQPAAAAGVYAVAPARSGPTRERVREFTGKNGVIWAIAFSPDGGLMASGDSDSTAVLWDAVEGRELRRFPGKLPFRSADFSPDGRRLALAAEDKGTNSLSLWDSARPDEVRALTGHQGRVSCVRFSPDGLLLASGGTGVHLWDVSSGRIIKSLKPGWLEPKVEAMSLAFSPDGRSIAVGDLHPSLWDVATGKEIRKFVSLGSIEKFRTVFVGFTPDGQSVVEARGNGKIRLWDIASGREKTCLADPPKQRDVAQGLQCGALSKDGTRLAVSHFSDAQELRGSVTLWNLLSGRPEATIAVSEACSALAFTPDGQWLAVADFTEEDGGQIKLHRISDLICRS